MAASAPLAGRACACWLLAVWMVSCTFDHAAAAAFPTVSPVFAPLRGDKITPAAVRPRALRDLTLPGTTSSQQQQQPSSDRPLLQTSRPHTIAHRGASGLLPEHTLAGYKLAIAQQADFVECDVIVTRDLALICRHEPNLNATTNAWVLFPDRARTVTIDGEAVSGIFAADLTLAEVRQLSARQRWPFRPQPDEAAGERHGVPTFGEFLDLVSSYSEIRAVGVYPEVKHPTWHNEWLAAFNTTIEELMVEQLHAHGYGSSAPFGSPAWRARPALIQSFEASSLRRLAGMTRLPLVLLLGGWPGFVAPDSGLSHEQMTSDAFLADLATFAVGAGPWKSSLYTIAIAPGVGSAGGAVGGTVEDDSSNGTSSGSGSDHLTHPDIGRAHEAASTAGPAGSSGSGSVPPVQRVSTGLAAKLHKHGLVVHPYTLRDEQQFVVDGCSDIACELGWLFDQEGVDGGFADFPGTLASWLLARERRQAAAQE